MIRIAAFCAVSAALSFALTRIVRTIALRRAMIDIPNERSSHTVPTPRGGGLGFVTAFLVLGSLDAVTGQWFAPPQAMRVFAVIIPLVLLGLADDAWNLPARSRLPVHLLLGGLTCALFGPVPLPFAPDMGTPGLIVQWAVTIVGTAALINFYNFMDGLDGLVAGTALVQMFFLAIQLDQPLWLLLAAGIAGFLPWNWPRASIFMGDAASTTLGACAAIAIVGCPTRGLAAEALAVTLPLTVDATYTILRRLSRRENIFHAHRSHIYQRLHNTAGWSHARVTTLYIALTILCALAITAFADYGPATCIALCLALLPLAELHIRRFASKTS